MSTTNQMHRWSKDHPLPVHVTTGAVTSFMLITPVRPPTVKQSRAVSVTTYGPINGNWRLEFKLNEDRYYPMFKSFYNDVYDNTWDVDIEHAADRILGIYKKWKRAFSTEGTPLTHEEVQGLIGEMCFIRDNLSEKYQAKDILDAWMLSLMGKQDFIFKDTWYEVKSTHVGCNSVMISSIEQLDNDEPGHLAVIKLKTTSKNDEKRITLGKIVSQLQDYFDRNNCGEDFLMKIGEMDLSNGAYEEQAYELVEYDIYSVNSTFPRLRRCDIPEAISSAEYELSLETLKEFRCE